METIVKNYLSPGIKLGDYEIVRLIGSGGMGDVYEVVFHGYDEPVRRALKIIPEHVKNNELTVEKMKKEVRLAQELSHPNIVKTYGYDSYQEHHFIIMEYVDGPNLKKYILDAGGKIELKRSLELLDGIAEAIDYAHELNGGIIHRDIKTENILYDNVNKCLKLSDFGIAAQIHAQSQTMTQDLNTLVGSPQYMPYEQFIGDTPSVDMDIYAFSIVLYEMLNGDPPFVYGDLRLQHKEKPVPELSMLNGTQMSVMKKALSKTPGERFRKATEIINGLKYANDITNTNDTVYSKYPKNINHLAEEINHSVINVNMNPDHKENLAFFLLKAKENIYSGDFGIVIWELKYNLNLYPDSHDLKLLLGIAILSKEKIARISKKNIELAETCLKFAIKEDNLKNIAIYSLAAIRHCYYMDNSHREPSPDFNSLKNVYNSSLLTNDQIRLISQIKTCKKFKIDLIT